jgi:hypothetical protein
MKWPRKRQRDYPQVFSLGPTAVAMEDPRCGAYNLGHVGPPVRECQLLVLEGGT